jgi:hypothetical protein
LNSLDNITVFGDSWGRGRWSRPDGSKEWGHGNDGDNYFTQSLQRYIPGVKNHSSGGKSNIESLRKLHMEINNNDRRNLASNIDNNKLENILVIQTEPIRDVLQFIGFSGNEPGPIYSITKEHNFQSYVNTLVDFFYYNLNLLAEKNNLNLYITAGCSDLNLKLLKKYKHVIPVCDSYYKLLDDSYTKLNSISDTYNISYALEKVSNKTNKIIINNLTHKHKIQEKYQEIYFGYAGDNHPSGDGIDLWIDHIIKNLTFIRTGKQHK